MAEYKCDVEGFEEAFVLFDDVWSRGDVRAFWDSKGEEHLQQVLDKIRGCRIPLVDGSVVTDPGELIIELLDDIDIRLWVWFSDLPTKHVLELQNLGEMMRRVSSNGTEPEQTSA